MRFWMIAFAAFAASAQTSQIFQLTQNQDPQELEQIAATLRGIADIQQVSTDGAKSTVTVEGTAAQIAMAGWLLHNLDLAAESAGVHEYRPPAGGDDVTRLFYVTHVSTPQELQEIVITLRSVADIRRVFVYSPLRAVAVRGTGQQISLAAWVVDRLNQPADAAAPEPHEYKLHGDDVARVFELAHPRTRQQLQEIVTLLRSIGDIQRLFVYSARRAVILRAPAERVALAAWLVSELDQPAPPATQAGAAPHEYRQLSGPDNLVRVFFLSGPQSAEARQNAATQVRMTARIPRLFVYNPLGALAVRGTAGQVATAERVLEEIKAQ